MQDNSDPFSRILVLYDVRSFESGQTFDIGIALFRTQGLDGTADKNDFAAGRIAFRGQPQVQSAVINDVVLPWVADSQWPGNAYIASNAQLYGSSDSLSFSYQNYYGSSFSGAARIAQPFGKVTFSSDTLSVSHPFTISYTNPYPSDSIHFVVAGIDTTVPDNGAMTIAANRVKFDSDAALYGFSISMTRKHFGQTLSQAGKLIGVFSEQQLSPGLGIPASK